MIEEHKIKHKDSQGLIDAAYRFAKLFHGDQKRKYTGEPYINHPVEVAQIVNTVTDDCNMICAALLHDVLEDTEATYQDFVDWGLQFVIYDLVVELTDVSKPEDGNRKARKLIDKNHLAKSSKKAATIKLADMLNNSCSIMKHDKRFAKVYMQEKSDLLKVLQHGDETLLKDAQECVNDYFSGNKKI